MVVGPTQREEVGVGPPFKYFGRQSPPEPTTPRENLTRAREYVGKVSYVGLKKFLMIMEYVAHFNL